MFLANHVLYRLYRSDGRLLYVGMTKNLTTRIEKHARDQPWWAEVADCRVEFYSDRETLLAAETTAITTELPAYNYNYADPTIRMMLEEQYGEAWEKRSEERFRALVARNTAARDHPRPVAPTLCARPGCDGQLQPNAAQQRKYCSQRCQKRVWREKGRDPGPNPGSRL
jgi:hypothetical protein